MDPLDILGSLLGGRKGGGGLGGKILTEILKGGASAGRPTPAPQSTGQGGSRVGRPIDLQQEASALEDLLNVAKDRYSQTQSRQPAPPARPQLAPQSAPRQPNSGGPFSFPSGRVSTAPAPRQNPAPDYRNDTQQANEDALLLIRAMINASKSDGDISEAEQQSIIQRIGNPTQDVINFLRQEFSQPLDVREFAWSVPIGMEQKVYSLSLAAIDLDVNSEATYLRDLAHGLRLPPDACNQIHRQFGAPEIF
jgi:Protein of unknown function (DUF533)